MGSSSTKHEQLIFTHKTSGTVYDLAWDQEGRLLVGQGEGQLDRLTLDQDKGQLLKAERLHTDQKQYCISSVSVNKSGDVGAASQSSKVYFNNTAGEPQVWSSEPMVIYLQGVVMFEDKYYLCGQYKQSQVGIYKLVDKSFLGLISIFNERNLSHMTRMGDNRLVISEEGSESLYLVDINTQEVTRVTPKHPGGGNVLGDPRGVSCDDENRIYVCDKSKKKVFVLSPRGEYLSTLGGDLGAGLRYPWALAVFCRPGKCPLLALSDFPDREVRIYALTGK